MEWLIFVLGIIFLLIVGIGIVAHVALKRADKVLGMDTNEDFDSEVWRHLLFEKFKEEQEKEEK